MEFIPNYLKICFKVIEKPVPFSGVCHESWKNMVWEVFMEEKRKEQVTNRHTEDGSSSL